MSKYSYKQHGGYRGDAQAAGSVIAGLVAQRSWGERLEQCAVFTRWAEIVGHETAVWTIPEVLRDDVLWLVVADAAHAQHLSYDKPHLLQRINRALGQRKIKDLRFRLGNIPAPAPVDEAPESPWQIEDSGRLERMTREIAACIKDEQIGRALARLRCKLSNNTP
jgi:predicted nucleic acid-binding Zn ribbon protein